MPTISLYNPETGRHCELELERGLTYAIEARTATAVEDLLEQLLRHPGTQVADGVGGAISSINVLENIGLPVIFHCIAPPAGLEEEVLAVLADCGIEGARAETLCRKRPGELGPFETRLAGFVRGLLMRPAVLVFSRFFEGLPRAEMAAAAALRAVYRMREPAGTAVHLLLHDMPVLEPDCDRRFLM